jgi:tight adherence protein B
MLLPLLVFLLVAGVIVGAYLAITMLPAAIKRRQLDERLRDVTLPAAKPTLHESVILRSTENAFLDRMAAGTRGGDWLAQLIEQSGVRTSPGQVIFLSLAAAGILAMVVSVFVRQSWAPMIAAPVGLVVPTLFLVRKRSARMKKFEEMFPEALDLLSRAVKAGHAFQTAMNMAAEELPDPVGPEFRKTFDQQNFGLPLRDALNNMVQRVPIIDVKFFVTAVLIQRETGGNLSEILDNLSNVVRERFKVLRQVRVHTAHGRFTGWVLMALPASLGVVLNWLNPEHMELLWKESMGHAMLGGAVVMQIVGYLWIKQIIKIEV